MTIVLKEVYQRSDGRQQPALVVHVGWVEQLGAGLAAVALIRELAWTGFLTLRVHAPFWERLKVQFLRPTRTG